MKELVTEQKNEIGEKNEKAMNSNAEFTPSDQDEEKSKELEKAVMEQENELGAKNEVAAIPKARACLQIWKRISQKG